MKGKGKPKGMMGAAHHGAGKMKAGGKVMKGKHVGPVEGKKAPKRMDKFARGGAIEAASAPMAGTASSEKNAPAAAKTDKEDD